MKLEFRAPNSGFVNAISVVPRSRQSVELSTHIIRPTGKSLRVYEICNGISYDPILEDARRAVGCLHERDFFIDPSEFHIYLDDDWEDTESSYMEADFDAPSQLKIWPGIRFDFEQPQKTKTLGQYAPSQFQNPQRMRVYVGNSSRVTAQVWKGQDGEIIYSPAKAEMKVLMDVKQLIRELIELSQIHPGSREFFPLREKYIREQIPIIFK